MDGWMDGWMDGQICPQASYENIISQDEVTLTSLDGLHITISVVQTTAAEVSL
jgi:hypothetical protein